MGAICAVQYAGQNYRNGIKPKNISITKSETQQNPFTMNKKVAEVTLGEYAIITSIYGHYSNHSGEVLVCVTTENSAYFCQELRDYACDAKEVIITIKAQRSVINEVAVKKSCPYKKFILCIVPQYNFKEDQQNQIHQYHRYIRVLARNLFQQYRNVTIYITQTSGQGMLIHNQTIFSLIFKELCTCLGQKTNVYMISPQIKILQMIRFQLLKSQACSNSVNQWNLRGLAKTLPLGEMA